MIQLCSVCSVSSMMVGSYLENLTDHSVRMFYTAVNAVATIATDICSVLWSIRTCCCLLYQERVTIVSNSGYPTLSTLESEPSFLPLVTINLF